MRIRSPFQSISLLQRIFCVLFALPLFSQIQEPTMTDIPLIDSGTYYYPEHWDEKDWERDIKKIKDMGFDFIHFAEFSWAQMEPREGEYDFSWLDRAIELASEQGLKIVLCTPTPATPRWLSEKHPEILIYNDEGRQIQHGARAHASWSSDVYRKYAAIIVKKLAKRYGKHASVMGWQIDNEPSHYGANWDYGPEAQDKFRLWLEQKYRTIDELNRVWGNDFWSQNYNHFGQIVIPNQKQLVQQANPHAILDFRRFTADEAAGFVSFQADILRKYISENQWVTTNYMPGHMPVDPRRSKDLDFVTYTKYIVAGYENGHGDQGFRMGSASNIGISNDFFRTITGTTGVMELQPGQVNWGLYNPQPMPGAIRMWLWHAFSGGCKLACNYRFRQPLTGGEQFHYGMVKTDGVTTAVGGHEYMQFIQEINDISGMVQKGAICPLRLQKMKTAIVYDLDSRFEQDYQPQTDRWSYMAHLSKYYDGLKAMGAPVDIIDGQQCIANYPFVVIPAFQLVDNRLIEKWRQYAENGGNLILTVRTGMKDREAKLWEDQWAAPITRMMGIDVKFFDHMPPGKDGHLHFASGSYSWNSWAEIIDPKTRAKVLAQYSDQFYKGEAAVVQVPYGKGTITYVGVDSKDGGFEKDLLLKLFEENGTNPFHLPEGVALNWRDGFWVVVNYRSETYEFELPERASVVVGQPKIPPAGVLVFQ